APGLVIVAPRARFSFVAPPGWCWLAHLEDRDLRDQRRLDGGRLPTSWRALVAIALVPGLLAFHEIEAQVFVLPPGMANFAMWMLQKLHYLRDDEMAAGALWTLGLATGFVGAMALVWRFGCNIRGLPRNR
ncbi:MAG: hypothetical protein KDA28_11700, partial [Phycisphaerales bacterium]|nr:hypothetical protein [Phycisphaerales bacterium]